MKKSIGWLSLVVLVSLSACFLFKSNKDVIDNYRPAVGKKLEKIKEIGAQVPAIARPAERLVASVPETRESYNKSTVKGDAFAVERALLIERPALHKKWEPAATANTEMMYAEDLRDLSRPVN